jgi:LacI family transcriptional regulator
MSAIGLAAVAAIVRPSSWHLASATQHRPVHLSSGMSTERTMTRPATGRRNGPGPATIADVAARARVGVTTVSRVLNDGQVSAPTRAKVLAAISDLAYRPRASARALASGATGTLGMVIPFFTHPSAVERVRGVLAALETASHELVLCNVADPRQRDDYLGRRAPLDRTDGLLIVSLSPRDEEAEAFVRAEIPVVLVDAHHPRLPSVVTDDVLGGELATRHLLELGHEQIAFIGDTSDPGFGFVACPRRLRGYRQALEAAGVPLRSELQREGPHDRLVAHRLTRELLSRDQPPTAIFAASDTQALGVLEAAGVEGFAVPDDLSVIGFDDLEVAPYVGLTTISQPLQESGRRGVERLLAGLRGEDDGPLEERLELKLEVRRTTAPPR